jgi:hypothetical protein
MPSQIIGRDLPALEHSIDFRQFKLPDILSVFADVDFHRISSARNRICVHPQVRSGFFVAHHQRLALGDGKLFDPNGLSSYPEGGGEGLGHGLILKKFG